MAENSTLRCVGAVQMRSIKRDMQFQLSSRDPALFLLWTVPGISRQRNVDPTSAMPMHANRSGLNLIAYSFPSISLGNMVRHEQFLSLLVYEDLSETKAS